MSEYATVEDVIEILQKMVDIGKGDYTVTCNCEYYLAKKDDRPDINDDNETLDLGGYI